MERATIAKLKNNLSAYLRKVRAGQPVIVYDRDVPIARLERIEPVASDQQRLASLRTRGLVRPAKHPPSAARLMKLLEQPAGVSGVLDALLKEREEGR